MPCLPSRPDALTGAPPRAVVGLLVVTTALLALAAPAAAHAVIVSSSPGDGAALTTPPDRVVIEFNEPVSIDLGGLRVFSSDGGRVDAGTAKVTDESLSVDLVDGLADGAYVASYRLVSADGHPVAGGIVFTVGDATADRDSLGSFFEEGTDRRWEVVGALARWLAYGGVFLLAGGLAFVVVADPHPNVSREDRRLLWFAAGAAVVGMLAAIPVQAALGTGTGLGALFENGVLRAVLAGGLGASTAVGVGGVALCLLGLRDRRIALLGATLAVTSFALVGHTRVGDNSTLATGADIVHLLAGAVWFGGLVFVVRFLRANRTWSDDKIDVISRFSTMATGAVVAVGLSGLALAWSEVRAVRALTSTTYGWTLIAKVGIVVAVAAAGAYNHFALVPRVRGEPSRRSAAATLRRTVSFEAVGLVLALLVTAGLVQTTPARDAAGIGSVFSDTIDLDDAGSVQVVVDPNRAGENTIHLYFYGPDGFPADLAEDVTVELSKPSDEIGPIVRTPERAGPAHLQLDGAELVTSGRWTITVRARPSRFEQVDGTTEVVVNR